MCKPTAFQKILEAEISAAEKYGKVYAFFCKIDARLFTKKNIPVRTINELEKLYQQWITYTEKHPEMEEKMSKFYVDLPYCLQIGREKFFLQ